MINPGFGREDDPVTRLPNPDPQIGVETPQDIFSFHPDFDEDFPGKHRTGVAGEIAVSHFVHDRHMITRELLPARPLQPVGFRRIDNRRPRHSNQRVFVNRVDQIFDHARVAQTAVVVKDDQDRTLSHPDSLINRPALGGEAFHDEDLHRFESLISEILKEAGQILFPRTIEVRDHDGDNYLFRKGESLNHVLTRRLCFRSFAKRRSALFFLKKKSVAPVRRAKRPRPSIPATTP